MEISILAFEFSNFTTFNLMSAKPGQDGVSSNVEGPAHEDEN